MRALAGLTKVIAVIALASLVGGAPALAGTFVYVSRGFAIDPKGKFLVAAGEKSDTISVYAIDQASGALKLLQKYPAGKGANWVEIVGFD